METGIRPIDVLEFRTVLAETITLASSWTGCEEDKRKLACIVSAAALLNRPERDHLVKLIVDADIRKASELKWDLEEGKETVFSASFPGLVDIVADDQGKPSFLFIEDGRPVIARAAEDAARPFEILKPPPAVAMPWLLCRGEQVIKHVPDLDNDLWDAINACLRDASDLPSEGYYDLLTAWLFHSWIYESSKYSPYIWFYGIWERGKTRIGESLVHLSRMALTVESAREAYLFRMSHRFGCTLFFDVENLWAKALKQGTTDFFLKRFEKGTVVARVLWPGRPEHEDMAFFRIYGPTIVATNAEVPEALASRAIQITMPESPRTFDNDIDPLAGLELKERLCAFRIRRMTQGPLPEVGKALTGRPGDIFRPLHRVVRALKPDREEAVLEVMRDIVSERSSMRRDCEVGRIVECLVSLKNRVANDCVGNKTIMDRYKELFPGYVLKPESMGRILRSLGLHEGKRTSASRSIIYDDALIDMLKKRMGI